MNVTAPNTLRSPIATPPEEIMPMLTPPIETNPTLTSSIAIIPFAYLVRNLPQEFFISYLQHTET